MSSRKLAGLLALAILIACQLGVARGEQVTGGNVRIAFHGGIRPRSLPRDTLAPIALHVAGRVTPLGDHRPEALRQVRIEVNRHAVATTHGLPRCAWRRLLSTTSRRALKVCGNSLIGVGEFSSHIDVPEQAPFPAKGRMLAFNSIRDGRPAIAVHIFGRDPVPTSDVLPMTIKRDGQGSFGPVVTIQMPDIGDEWGYVDGFDLTLKRVYRYRGRRMSVISASCPAPADLRRVPFRAARGAFELADGRILTRAIGGTCTAIR